MRFRIRPVVMIAFVVFIILCDQFAPNAKTTSSKTENLYKSNGAYVFAYFKGNGEDGLHLAYSNDGLFWKSLNRGRSLLQPSVGSDKLMRDPHLSFGPDGLFHLVWTTSWTEAVIGHATSKDLIHWSEQQTIKPMRQEPNVQNVWAPELFYDAGARRYLLFWSTTISGRFPAMNDNRFGHRIYVSTTRDFRTFEAAHLFYDPGFNVIDATIVKDRNRYIMFFKNETQRPTPEKNIRYAVSKKPAGPYSAPSSPITGHYWSEGPSAIKIGGTWFVYFDRYLEHRYGGVSSIDMQQWEDISAELRFPE